MSYNNTHRATYGPFWDFVDTFTREFDEALGGGSRRASGHRGHGFGHPRGHGGRYRCGGGSREACGSAGACEQQCNCAATASSESGGIAVSPFKCRRTGDDELVTPAVDVYDTPDSYIVVGSIPGADASSLNVDFDVQSRSLTLSGAIVGSRAVDQNDELKQYLKVNERRVGKFERSITFPEEHQVDEEGISAKAVNGVIKIVIPKVKPVVPEKKKITVTIEDEEEDSDKTEKPTDESDSVLVEKE